MAQFEESLRLRGERIDPWQGREHAAHAITPWAQIFHPVAPGRDLFEVEGELPPRVHARRAEKMGSGESRWVRCLAPKN